MRASLTPHPDFPCDAVTSIEIAVTRQGAMLTLDYLAEGRMRDVRVPPATAPARTDGLWKHTCFEAFVRPKGSAAYWEFNFAPSGQWVAYRFESCREGMRNAAVSAPSLAPALAEATLSLRAVVSLEQAIGFADAPWELGVTAVIEEMNGRRSYWSLRHPPGRPDFHHSDGFALEIPAA